MYREPIIITNYENQGTDISGDPIINLGVPSIPNNPSPYTPGIDPVSGGPLPVYIGEGQPLLDTEVLTSPPIVITQTSNQINSQLSIKNNEASELVISETVSTPSQTTPTTSPKPFNPLGFLSSGSGSGGSSSDAATTKKKNWWWLLIPAGIGIIYYKNKK